MIDNTHPNRTKELLDQLDSIHHDYHVERMSYADMIEKYRTTKSTLNQFIAKYIGRREPNLIPQHIKQEIDYMWENDYPATRIARLLNIHLSTVRRHLGDRYEKRTTPEHRFSHKWGSKHITSDGYVRVLVSISERQKWNINTSGHTSYILEHRLVMMRHLDRPLTSNESVHHINGNRQDNRLENLQLRQKYHGDGSLFKCRNCGSHDVEAIKL